MAAASGTPTGDVTSVLDAHRGSLTLHHRFIMVGSVPVLLDHVLSSTGGAYLIQERPDLADVDTVRRAAEVLESAVSRPIDPILVLTGADVSEPTVRGVRVVKEADFGRWVAELPESTTRSEMVLINARVEKATEDWTRHRRIPDWEVRARLSDDGILTTAPAAARRPLGGPGPRAWSPADNYAATRIRSGARRGLSRQTWIIIALIGLAVLLALYLS